MGKTKRDKLRRELAQALHHIEIAKGDVGAVWAAFEGRPDNYPEYLEMIGTSLTLIQNQIKVFWLTAWGKVPDNFDSYRC